MRELGVGLLAVLAAACGRIGFESDPSLAGPDAGIVEIGGEAPGATPASLDFLVGIQGRDDSFLARLRYSPDADEPLTVVTERHLSEVPGNAIRGLDASGDEVFVGMGGQQRVVRYNTALTEMRANMNFDGAVGSSHGLCALDNGNLVIGESGPSSGNLIAEYTMGAAPTYQQDVTTTAITSGSLSQCAQVGDDLFLTDYAAYSDRDGDLVKLSRVAESWQEVQRFNMSSFASSVGLAKTGLYSFVHRNESFYLFPMRRLPGMIDRLIRCPESDIDDSQCELLGLMPPDTNPSDNSPDTLQGAIAGFENELLFSSNRYLYSYDLQTDDWTIVADLEAALALARPGEVNDRIEVVRGLVPVP